MITAEDLKKLDDRTLKWYRKQLAQFHQDCLKYDKCYCVEPVFHKHFKELENLITNELNSRE